MAEFTSKELTKIERRFANGISSHDIVKIMKGKGERFSEPTLRKYVQLGLLPKSRRVGIRGKHRGSSGLYPATVVRLIVQIKKSLEEGATLEEIRYGTVGLSGEIEALSTAANRVFERFTESLPHVDAKARPALRRAVGERKKAFVAQLRLLEQLCTDVGRKI